MEIKKTDQLSSMSVSTQTLLQRDRKLTSIDPNPVGSEESDSSSKIAFPPSSDSELCPGCREHNSGKWSALPGGFRDWRVHSRKSLLDDSPLYDVIIGLDEQKNKQICSAQLGNNVSSRLSTLSQDTYVSLGYASGSSSRQRNSPCPSSVTNVSPIYDSISGPCHRRGSYYSDFRRRHKSGSSNGQSRSTVRRPQSVHELRNRDAVLKGQGYGSKCHSKMIDENRISFTGDRFSSGNGGLIQRSKSIPLTCTDNEEIPEVEIKTFINDVGMIETHFNCNNKACSSNMCSP